MGIFSLNSHETFSNLWQMAWNQTKSCSAGLWGTAFYMWSYSVKSIQAIENFLQLFLYMNVMCVWTPISVYCLENTIKVHPPSKPSLIPITLSSPFKELRLVSYLNSDVSLWASKFCAIWLSPTSSYGRSGIRCIFHILLTVSLLFLKIHNIL